MRVRRSEAKREGGGAMRSASPLANVTYRRLFGAQVVALVGTGLTTVALSLLAYDLAGGGAGAVVGIALALKMVVYVFGSPLLVALTARLPRRRVLVGLDLLRAGTVAAMPFVTEVWQVYVLIVLVNAGSAGFTPTFQATIPDVLPDEPVYTRALSLSRLAYELEALLSPALAALLLAFVAYDGLFAANGVAFLASAALVLSASVPARRAAAADAEPWRERLTGGIRLYLATPRLRGLLALNVAAAAASATVIVNSVVYVRDLFGRDAGDVAWALGASGAGAMVVALALPKLLERIPDRPVMLTGGGLLALALVAASLVGGFASLLAVWVAIGAGLSLVQTPAGRLIARSGDERTRPGLFAAQFSLSHLGWLLTYPLAGVVGTVIGLSATALLLAATAVLATILAAVVWPAGDGAARERRPRRRPRAPHARPLARV